MLKPTGVLAICIDHRELFHLGQMLDELFGEQNRLAIINWQKDHLAEEPRTGRVYSHRVRARLRKGRGASQDRHCRTPSGCRRLRTSPDADPKGAWSPADSTLMGASTHPGQVYGIQNPFTGKLHYPQEGRCWRNERAKMKAAVEEWGVSVRGRAARRRAPPSYAAEGCPDPPHDDSARRTGRARGTQAVLVRRRARGRLAALLLARRRAAQPRRRRASLQDLPRRGQGGHRADDVLGRTRTSSRPTSGRSSWDHQQSGTSDTGQAS